MFLSLKKNTIGYICAVAAALFWGFHAVVIRMLIHQGVDPFLIGGLRLFIGSAFLAMALSAFSFIKKLPLPRIPYTRFFWIAALGIGINFLLFHKGMEFTIASDAVLLEAFSPVMVLVLVMIFIPARIKHLLTSPGLLQRIFQTLIIGSIGSSLLLINTVGDPLISPRTKFIGDAIEFVAMLTWSCVLLGMHEYQKREQNHHNLMATTQFLFFAGLLVAPFVPWLKINDLSATQLEWILVLGFFSTGFSYLLWHTASKYLDVFPLMAIFNFGSIFNVIIESLALGVPLNWKLIVGGLFIVYAAVKAEMINSKYKAQQEEIMP